MTNTRTNLSEFTYTEIRDAAEMIWPNVSHIDLFLERLTPEQIARLELFLVTLH